MGKRKHVKKKHDESEQQHTERKTRERVPRRKKMSAGSMIFIGLFGVIIIYAMVVAMGGGTGGDYQEDPDFDYDGLSQCILDNEAIFYGTNWCEFCQRQKRILGPTYEEHGDEFFVDCDANSEECRQAGVTSYPTWVIGDQRLTGVQELETLASAAGCSL